MPDTLVGTPDPGFCNHRNHAGGHGPMPFGPGCWCGIPTCTICPDVEPLIPADGGSKKVRQFASGATRDTDEGKLDYEAYLSPLVLLRYAEYMQKHQTRSDGTKRAGDDWQAGMPKAEYMKSMSRHVMDVWLHHRGYTSLAREDLETALCAVIFNAMGYLFNELEGLDP